MQIFNTKIKRISGIALSIVMALSFSACANSGNHDSGKQDAKGTMDYLKEYVAENGFTVEAVGEEQKYYDYEASEKLYAMISEMDDKEKSSDLLSRFTKVDNQLLEIKKTTSQGTESIYCHYDAEGKMVKKYLESDEDYYYTYTYNEQGLLTEKKQIQIEDNAIEATFAYVYDEHGNCVKYVDEHGRNYPYKYTYDAQGRIAEGIRTEVGPDGEIIIDNTLYTYQYNNQGQVIKLSGKSTHNTDIIYDFIYDAEGNLTKETKTEHEAVTVIEYVYKDNQLSQKIKTVTAQITLTEQYTYTYGTRYYFDAEGLSF